MIDGLAADQDLKVIVLTLLIQSKTYTDKDRLREGLEASLARLHDAGKKVIIMQPIPTYGFDPINTLARRLERGLDIDNIGIPRRHFENSMAPHRALIQRLATQFGLTIFDPTDTFCDGELCRLFRPEIGVMYFNREHMSLAAGRELEKTLRPMLGGENLAGSSPATGSG